MAFAISDCAPRFARFVALVSGLAIGAGLSIVWNASAFAGLDGFSDEGVIRAVRRAERFASRKGGFTTAADETVWVGYKATSADANKVAVGGVWDFDAGASTSDSAQFWRFWQQTPASDPGNFPNPADRPQWYRDYGNNINIGNHNLWRARSLAGRTYRRTGLIGVWHSDDMSGVSAPIAGSRSAWCGVRASGSTLGPVDEVTGNRYTNEAGMPDFRGGAAVRSTYPGYGHQWDQILYRDFTYSGSAISVSFRLRADMDPNFAPDAGTGVAKSAWHNPSPLNPANLVDNPADSLMVWAGAPRDVASDPNRRWLDDVLNFTSAGLGQPVKIFSVTSKVPAGHTGSGDSLVSVSIPSGRSWGGTVRLAFQVKTNRLKSDQTNGGGVWDSADGAVLIDDVNVGGNVSGFESVTDIRPRVPLSATGVETTVNPATTWITTGRPVDVYFHPVGAASLNQYADPCGDLFGGGDRLCNLRGVVLTAQNPPLYRHVPESQNWATSPTIAFVGPRAADQGTAAHNLQTTGTRLNIEFDYYSGNDDPTVTGNFFMHAVRFYGPTLLQTAPAIPNWSAFAAPGVRHVYGSPMCQVEESDNDLAFLIPFSATDSVQIAIECQVRCVSFGATDCGGAAGGWWDNIRAGFVKGGQALPQLQSFFWHLYGDQFPVNAGSNPAPGTVHFDTTTALVKTAINLGPDNPAATEGVVNGDTLVYTSPYAGGVRLDLVFRILPGPGNYSTKGNPASQLLKVPSNPGLGNATAGDGSFWGTYMASNGAVGSANGHTATRWNPDTWNSARMDSAELNLGTIVQRNIGIPPVSNDQWRGTYHESDPKYATLGITRNVCFLVDQGLPNDHTNICCSAAQCATDFGESFPPAGYAGGTPTTTIEGTKIIPDGLLTPGSLVQYFVRRSLDATPGTHQVLSPDTTKVSLQSGMGGYFDQLRFDHFDVLPDLWKDPRFNAAVDAAYPAWNKGNGLACILVVDGRDGIGLENALGGALDSTGYGQDNGAVRGWKQTLANYGDVDDPAGFVAQNLGQKGLAYDWWDQRAGESNEGHRLGCRYASNIPAATAGKQCTAGPTLEMLNAYYNTIIWASDDLDESAGAFHDGQQNAQQSNDIQLLQEWLDEAASGDARALWVNGDGAATYLLNASLAAQNFLANYLGATVTADNYFAASGNIAPGMIWKPLGAASHTTGDAFHAARRYGMYNSCQNEYDVLDVSGTVGADAARATRYEQQSDRAGSTVGAGPFYASIYRRNTGVRNYATLLDGFSFRRGRAWNGPSDPTTSLYNLTYNNNAQKAFLTDVLAAAFFLCSFRDPTFAIGDQPGLNAVNFVRGAFPNPARAGQATVNFTLAKPAKVTIRFYDVAGRLVHETDLDGVSGANQYRWNGLTSTGQQATSGVYFYRLSAPGVEFQNNSQRMVLLGQAGD